MNELSRQLKTDARRSAFSESRHARIMRAIQDESEASGFNFRRNLIAVGSSVAALFLIGFLGWNARPEPASPQAFAELSSPVRLLNAALTPSPSFESRTMRADALRFADTFVNTFKQAEHLAVPQS